MSSSTELAPPPELAHVPLEYVLHQLRSLGPQMYMDRHAGDCTIVVPGVSLNGGRSMRAPEATPIPFTTASSSSNGGRRATEPAVAIPPTQRLTLHSIFLSTQSALLREILITASPLDHIPSPSRSTIQAKTFAPFHIPRYARLLPSHPSHPEVYLPVPDPASIDILFHFMYFGDTEPIAYCLEHDILSWRGLAQNVEYLRMAGEIKWFLHDWYFKHEHPRPSSAPGTKSCGESTSSTSDEEDVDEYIEDACEEAEEAPDIAMNEDDGTIDNPSPKEDKDDRGRTRTIRPLACVNTPAD